MANSIQWGIGIALLLAASYAAGYGAVEAYGSWYERYTRTEDWNKRGYVRCVDGVLNAGNIDFEGDLLHPIECKPQ